MNRVQQRTAYYRAAEWHDKVETLGCCDAMCSVGASFKQRRRFQEIFEPDECGDPQVDAWLADSYYWPRKINRWGDGDEEWEPCIVDQRVMALLFMHWMQVNP